MSHIVPRSWFSLVFVNVTNIFAITLTHWTRILVFQQFCLLSVFALSLMTSIFFEICFFLTIPVAETLVHISGWLLWYFYLDFRHSQFFFHPVFQKKLERLFSSVISVQLSHKIISLLSHESEAILFTKLRSLFWFWSLFSPFLFLVAVIPAALVSWVVSHFLWWEKVSMVRIISSSCPHFPFLFYKLFYINPLLSGFINKEASSASECLFCSVWLLCLIEKQVFLTQTKVPSSSLCYFTIYTRRQFRKDEKQLDKWYH